MTESIRLSCRWRFYTRQHCALFGALFGSMLYLGACSNDDPNTTTGEVVPDQGVDANESIDLADGVGADLNSRDQGQPDTFIDLAIPEGCNPIAFLNDCMLPYPSDVFLVDDASLPSGRRLVIPDAAKPKYRQGRRPSLDLSERFDIDGFSHLPVIMALFPEGVREDELIFHTEDVTQTLSPGATTILLEADTGEPVLHFSEIDYYVEDDAQRPLYVRPMVRLKNNTRYIVAIKGLFNAAGEPLEAPEGFRQIVEHRSDPSALNHPVLKPLAEHYAAEIFPTLQAFGVAPAELVLAWDFTTQSREIVTRDMLKVRQDTIAYFESNAPSVTVQRDTADPYDEIARDIRVRLEVPLFLRANNAGTSLHRGEDGLPEQNGTSTTEVRVLIPKSVANAGPDDPPARLLQYGHGFFGNTDELSAGWLRRFINEYRFVLIGVNWDGMAVDDMIFLGLTLGSDAQSALTFVERVPQGMANAIALTYAAKQTLPSLAEFQNGLGESVYDPEHVYYYGISQGHILGGTYIPLSPHIERAVFSVGGAAFAFMMSRARPFIQFLEIIEAPAPDRLTVLKFVSLIPIAMDRIDPITYAPYVLKEPLPGTPDQKLLVQTGLGDDQVPYLASHLHMRALGVPQMQPAPRPIAGLQTVTAEENPSSAFVEVDFNLSDEPLPGTYAEQEGEENEVHEGVRRVPELQQQIDAFLRPNGTILHLCEGACNPD